MDRVLNICQKENLDVVMIEDKVYKNITSDKVVNIDKLKRELENCWLLISDTVRKEKENGYYTFYAKVYYIIDDADDDALVKKYGTIVDNEYGEVFVEYFKFDPNGDDCISTIYGADELGRV